MYVAYSKNRKTNEIKRKIKQEEAMKNAKVSFNCAHDASLTINDHPSGSSLKTTIVRECTVRQTHAHILDLATTESTNKKNIQNVKT